MKKSTIIMFSRLSIAALMLGASLCLFSFTSRRLAEDFLQQLGITKVSADDKIINSLLGGYLDQYGLRNAKNIALGNRGTVTKDLLAYTKEQVASASFLKAYNQLRDNNKPKLPTIQTPEEMRNGLIEQYKKSIAETEANYKKAEPSMKSIFEPILATMKQELKNAQDPNNAMLANYKENYPEMMKSVEAANKQQLADWEAKYPANHQLFVKARLQQFMQETANIDFNAQLVEKNGRKYFVNPAYEHMSNRWKLAFRAGKEVIAPAREFVQQWINEIK